MFINRIQNKQKNNIMSENNKKLPVLKDLVANVGVYKKQDEFNYLVNQEPPSSWVKTHPFIKNHKYIPIDKVEYLLRSIFKSNYKIEITGQGTAFNGVWVSVRVHFKDVITEEWKFYDGIGACELQTKKGTSPSDLANINNGAISMAFPIAKTLAVKDATDHFGNLFGANLNRKDIIPYKTPESLIDPDYERQELLIKNAKTQDDVDFARPHITDKKLLAELDLKEIQIKNGKK